MADESIATPQTYEQLALSKIRYHHALWIVCGRDRAKVNEALALADAEHDYSAVRLRSELQEAEEEVAYLERMHLRYRIPDRLVAARRRVDELRAAIGGVALPDGSQR